MARYTVHVPEGDLERSVFVRDGWSWGAFAFGPFWLARHRHWLSFVLALLAMIAVFAGLILAPLGGGAKAAIVFLIACLWGLEGSSLRRLALRRRYAEAALATGSDREALEARVFAALSGEAAPEQPAAAPATVFAMPATARMPVIGLFPEARKP